MNDYLLVTPGSDNVTATGAAAVKLPHSLLVAARKKSRTPQEEIKADKVWCALGQCRIDAFIEPSRRDPMQNITVVRKDRRTKHSLNRRGEFDCSWHRV